MQIKLWSLTMATFFMLGSVDVFALCGNSQPDAAEQCDDGNSVPGDGCSSSCQIEPGFECTAAIAGTPPTPSVCGVATESYAYSGEVTLCTGTCASFASLAVGSTLTGIFEIGTSAGSSFGDSDMGPFEVKVTNPGLPVSGPVGDATTDNPLVLDSALGVAASNGTIGTTDGANQINGGTMLLEFLTPPLSSNGAFVVIDLATGAGKICLFYVAVGCIPGATESVKFEGSFSLIPPGSIQVDPSTVSVDENAGIATVTVTRTGGNSGEVGATYRTVDGSAVAPSDYTQILATTVTFADGDTASKSISVSIIDDNDPESAETFVVQLASPTGGASLGNSVATVTIKASDLNQPPVAEKDSFDASEDTLLTVPAPGVLDNDTDGDGDALTAVLDTDVASGTLDLSADGSFTYDPDENYCGKDGFTYHANDGAADSNIATVSITVACLNDPPEVTSVSLALQTVDYSDDITTVTVEVTDIDDVSTTLADAPVVASLGVSPAGCVTDNSLSPNPAEDGSVCTFSYSGQVLSPGDNVHDIVFTPSDGDGAGSVTGTHELTIEAEDATVMLDGDNEVAAEVAAPGGDSGPFSLFFAAYETDDPDFSHGSAADFGDLKSMKPFMTLVPVGPGSPVDAVSCGFIAPLPLYPAEGYDQEGFFQCDFDDVPVNTYEVVAAVDGASGTTRYYVGSDDDVFTVFDPSLGFTTGGGWFYWPGTANEELTECGPDGYPGDKTNFGFNLKYNKKKKTAKGSVLVMRHTVDESCLDAGSYRVKSNAIEGMSLGEGEDAAGPYGWAVAAGKSTYRELDLENEGNHPFLLYVEDHGEQGCAQAPTDEFWIEVKDKDEAIVLQLNGPQPAGADEASDGEDEPIICGNIVVPHKAGKGDGGGGPKGPNPNKPPKG